MNNSERDTGSSRLDEKRAPEERFGAFSIEEARRASRSPLNGPAWRAIWTVIVGSMAAFLLQGAWPNSGTATTWTLAFVVLVSWAAAVRFLLLDSMGKKFWLAWLTVGLLFLLGMSGLSFGWATGFGMSLTFLLFRTYKPLRHLTSARRAAVFLFSIASLVLLTAGWEVMEAEREIDGGLHRVGDNVLQYSLWSLRVFWFFVFGQLVLRMRLHFMRLKPKLLTGGLLLAGVPMFLMLVFWIVAMFSALGANRTTQARDILYHWARRSATTASSEALIPLRFRWAESDSVWTGPSTMPGWFPTLVRGLGSRPSPKLLSEDVDSGLNFGFSPGSGIEVTNSASSDSYWSPVDTLALFTLAGELWLLDIQGIGPVPEQRALEVRGFEVTADVLSDIAGIVRANLWINDDENSLFGLVEADSVATPTGKALNLRGVWDDPDLSVERDSSWLNRLLFDPITWGGSLVRPIRQDPDQGFQLSDAVLYSQIRVDQIGREFLSGDQQINQFVLAMLVALALALLNVQLFALFFGLRITTGITGAVKALHSGTKRLATGNLDTRIVIPNEDELGDLAHSFNEMTNSVRLGREEAVERDRLEREIETARLIQERLLPSDTPPLPGFEVTGVSIPNRQVGGDYFDFLSAGDGKAGFAIADVSGKGIPAALLMANLQASLQGQVIHPSSVSEVVARVNQLLVQSTDVQMFATFFYAVLDLHEGTLTSTNAGHDPPIVVRADGTVERLEVGGVIIGILPDRVYEQESTELRSGDSVVLYTDGITEAASKDSDDVDEMFGEGRLIEVARENRGKSAAGIKEAILSAVSEHGGETAREDDVTLVVIKRTEV